MLVSYIASEEILSVAFGLWVRSTALSTNMSKFTGAESALIPIARIEMATYWGRYSATGIFTLVVELGYQGAFRSIYTVLGRVKVT